MSDRDPLEPPAEYGGPRVGDVIQRDGRPVVVTGYRYEHELQECALGDACQARWGLLVSEVPPFPVDDD